MKAIYTKWLKEELENKYDIFPLGAVPNPKKPQLKAWLYDTNNQFMFALNAIMEDKRNGNKER